MRGAGGGPKPKSLESRFWAFVHPEPNSGCWLWTGFLDRDGYGKIRLGGRDSPIKPATHVSLSLYSTPVPEGCIACHRCDNPPCVNPDHLFVGTQLDNVYDCIVKGRSWSNPGGMFIKEKCVNGHPKNGANLYMSPSGKRGCRICRSAASVRSRTLVCGPISCEAFP